MTQFKQVGDPLIPDVEWVRSLINYIQNQINTVVTNGVTSVVGGTDIDVDNSTPTAPIVSFNYDTITHAALLAQTIALTAANGFYFVTARPTSGTLPLLVQVVGNKVSPLAWVVVQHPVSLDFFVWTIENYDFANDTATVICHDSKSNRFMANISFADPYIYLPADDVNSVYNDIASGNASDFTGFTGAINFTRATNGGRIFANNSAALILKSNISSGDLDVQAVVAANNVSVDFRGTASAETLTVPAAGLLNISIDLVTGQSNYPVTLSAVANVIDFNENAEVNWGGIATIDKGQTIDTISNGAFTTKFITLKPPPTAKTSGTLVVGVWYTIYTVAGGDDFANVGYLADGVAFEATGANPTVWANSTEVYEGLTIDPATQTNINLEAASPVIHLFRKDNIVLEYDVDTDEWYQFNLSQFEY